ncbi:hypothetical protein, partial [Pandoraea pnomenusa]|uniref:hypothetical protein n=2 Tax=Pandoraea TaxID=93217 RepID=UPI001EE20EB5
MAVAPSKALPLEQIKGFQRSLSLSKKTSDTSMPKVAPVSGFRLRTRSSSTSPQALITQIADVKQKPL